MNKNLTKRSYKRADSKIKSKDMQAGTFPVGSSTSDALHRTPRDLQKLLNSKSNADVLAKWNTLTPLTKNEWICWVTIVKKEETRAKHLIQLCDDLRKGKRRPCCWPGCPHRRPSAQKWFGSRGSTKTPKKK